VQFPKFRRASANTAITKTGSEPRPALYAERHSLYAVLASSGDHAMNVLRRFISSLVPAAILLVPVAASAQTILHAPEASKLLPDSVYYAGKSANAQLRNSAGIHYSDNHYVFAVLVDTSGYSTSIQEKYQGYFLIEIPIEIDGKNLPAGAYGIGFVNERFVVTDIGGHEILQARASHDEDLQRPMPLQILQGTPPDHYRLCLGRSCVVLRRR
jgi:hypothetical protein